MVWVAVLLVFPFNFEPSPTVRYLPKMEAECVWSWIILASVIIAHYYANKLIPPTVTNPPQTTPKRESCFMVAKANFIPSEPNLGPTKFNIEHWLRWIEQVSASLMFVTNHEPSPTGCYLPNLKAEFGRWWNILFSVFPRWCTYRLISPTISKPLQKILQTIIDHAS